MRDAVLRPRDVAEYAKLGYIAVLQSQKSAHQKKNYLANYYFARAVTRNGGMRFRQSVREWVEGNPKVYSAGICGLGVLGRVRYRCAQVVCHSPQERE